MNSITGNIVPLLVFILSIVLSFLLIHSDAFHFHNPTNGPHRTVSFSSYSPVPSLLILQVYNDDEEREQIEEARLGVCKSRRGEIRSMLKSAESLRNFRLDNGFVPELDEDGNPVKEDGGKTAVTLTAFAVTAGAIILRVGGRAALISTVGLDFANDNPELQNQINQVLDYSDTMNPIIKSGLFFIGWTLVKTFCFDAAGIVLAFSSGILFGGVIQGALMSAIGATLGSSVAFGLAKVDTPVRKKALEVVEENPSLRGLEKVVAAEGLKAILTLRLAPILPIPLGMYNYVYGISNVRYWDFAGGIFLGSLKPYFLDSYLGYFGKTIVDGSAATDGGGTLQDYALIAVLGVSVLIGVFASQLASETWDVILKEQEEEEKKLDSGDNDSDDIFITEFFGQKLPQWLIGFQYGLQDAEQRIEALVLQEYDAKVWNYTDSKSLFGMQTSKGNALPDDLNPALMDPRSPEITGRYQGFDFGAATCEGLVLSPILFQYFFKFADPLFDEMLFDKERIQQQDEKAATVFIPRDAESIEKSASSSIAPTVSSLPNATEDNFSEEGSDNSLLTESTEKVIFDQLNDLKDETKKRLYDIDKKMSSLKIKDT